MKTDKELKAIYKKYICRPMYRVIPSSTTKEILKKGINPKKDPFEKIKPKLRRFFNLINRLEKKGIVLKLKWGNKIVKGSTAVKICNVDLNVPYVDFCPNKKDVEYFKYLEGGALITNISRLTKKLLEKKDKLTKKDFKLVKELNVWANKRKCKNDVIAINGDSFVFENALLQLRGLNPERKTIASRLVYLKSPFGSFHNFKKIINKYGYRKYAYTLKNGKFFLRVKDKIPAKEIKKRK